MCWMKLGADLIRSRLVGVTQTARVVCISGRLLSHTGGVLAGRLSSTHLGTIYFGCWFMAIKHMWHWSQFQFVVLSGHPTPRVSGWARGQKQKGCVPRIRLRFRAPSMYYKFSLTWVGGWVGQLGLAWARQYGAATGRPE